MGHTPEVFGAKRIVSCVFVGMLARIVVVATVDATRHAFTINIHIHSHAKQNSARSIAMRPGESVATALLCVTDPRLAAGAFCWLAYTPPTTTTSTTQPQTHPSDRSSALSVVCGSAVRTVVLVGFTLKPVWLRFASESERACAGVRLCVHA